MKTKPLSRYRIVMNEYCKYTIERRVLFFFWFVVDRFDSIVCIDFFHWGFNEYYKLEDAEYKVKQFIDETAPQRTKVVKEYF